MEDTEMIKPLAFSKVNSIEKNRRHLEEVMENSLSIDNDSLQYEEIGEILEREFSIDARENSAVKMLTVNICQTYKICKNDFDFEETMKPRRELTMPSEGQGISGQVFKCIRKEDEKNFAIKIIKNKKAYKNQALIELRILEILNNDVDKQDLHHIIRLFDHFVYKEHLCIIFELLNENLFELLRQNYFQGISLNSIRFIIKQILEAVYQLERANLIHCDLKPENILLKIDKDNHRNDIVIKITDFGSACFKNHTMFQYIQSRYYRAPEVLIGARYSCEIDIWSIGCIAAELFLGEPIFPGACEYDQLSKIVKLTGDVPTYLIKEGKNSRKYFTYDQEKNKYRIKTVEEYYKEFPTEAEPKYEIPNDLKNLDDIANKNNKKQNLNSSNNNIGNDLESFVHFLKGLLIIDPNSRWNAKQALKHPFITKEKFDGYFNPNHEEASLFFHSVEGSYISDYYPQYLNRNSNMCQSMMINPCNNISYNGNFNNSAYYENQNSSIDMSVYQPNLKNIPLHLLKNFPYAGIDEINLKPGNNKGQQNKLDGFMNKTFMKTSHDEIHVNTSYNSDHKHHFGEKFKNKHFIDDINKNKNSQISKMVQNLKSNNLDFKNNFPNMNNNMMNFNLNINHNNNYSPGMQMQSNYSSNDRSQQKRNSNYNKSLFNKDNTFHNNKEYDGLYCNDQEYFNHSFDNYNRSRSKSDYYNTPILNQKQNTYNYNNYNNLNYSNCSTYTNEKDHNQYMKQPMKNLSSNNTPIVNANKFYKIEEKESDQIFNQIKEEDHQGDEENILKFN